MILQPERRKFMSNAKKFDSFAISASAGCGKTEEMAIRLLGMFLSDPEPEKIFNSVMAVTFSQSGAREIYNRIIEILFDTVLDSDIEKFNILNDRLSALDMNIKIVTHDDIVNLLRKLIFSVNDLQICTIDSFMNKIVQSFSTELSLPGKAELISESEEEILKVNTLKKLLLSSSYQFDQSEEKIEDIALESKKTSYGRNSRKYFSKIQENIKCYERLLDDNPDSTSYAFSGNVEDLFSLEKREEALYILENNPSQYRRKSTKDKAALLDVMDKVCYASTDTHFNNMELKRLRDFYQHYEEIRNGFKITASGFSSDHFSKDERNALILLLQYASYILIKQNAVRSDGFMNIARAYRKLYSETFYKQGKITFADLPRLLGNCQNSWTYDIAYRLNNKFCNYLIDEFQDTSRIQWQVISEIFGTPSLEENKSLFIVGDVKQAIYNWRSGDRRLMPDVIEKMKKQINLQQKPLDVSFRYGKSICSALNLIFDNMLIKNAGFFPGTGEAWSKIFKPHSPSDILKYRSRFDAYLSLDKDNHVKNSAALILRKIKESDIIEKHKSCAILVRKNKEGLALLEELQQDPDYGKYFIWIGNDKIGNNKIINALVNLLIYIQHPADTMACGIAEMLPSVRFLIPASREKLEQESYILKHSGFYEYLKNCIDKIKKRNNNKPISFCDRESLELFLNAAAEFDRTSLANDSRYFKEYINHVKHSTEAIGYKIKLMTIHHSKGLTFEHVFTAINGDTSIINKPKNIPIAGSYADNSRWILNSINDEFSIFPEINKAWNEFTAEQMFEKICLMYVALSRAKYTMTLILPPLADAKMKLFKNFEPINNGKNSYYLTDYITETLFRCADADETEDEFHFMHAKIDDAYIGLPIEKEKTLNIKETPPLNFKMLPSPNIRRRRIRPSDGLDENDNGKNGKLFFNLPDESKGKFFGEDLHRFLCDIDDFSAPALPPDTPGNIRDEIAKISANNDLCKLLNDYDECWKERSFDVIIKDYYISGCFDRVQIHRNPDGSAADTIIIDYKSGSRPTEINDKVKRYHRQLNTYRMALSQLLKLSVAEIKCFIIWTQDAVSEEVKP